MHFFKDIVLDVAITLGIISMVIMETDVLGLGMEGSVTFLWWVLAVYTALMVLIKAVALASARTLRQMNMQDDSVPPNVHRLLYAVNAVALLTGAFYLLAAGWVVIWALSEAVRVRTAAPAPA